MKAVILAAGYATRLYPLTENIPKCLLKVGGRFILDHIVAQLNSIPEIEEIHLVTNARFFEPLSVWRQTASSRAPIRILSDGTTSNENRLGAIGDFNLLIQKEKLSADVLLLASDNLFEQSLRDFTLFAASKKGHAAIGVYDLGNAELAAGKFGVIETDRYGEVTGFEEKPQKPKSSLIGMGVYYFPAASLGLVDEYLSQKNAQDAPGHYVRWLLGRVQIFTLRFKGLWYDIGDLKSLEEADRIFKSKNV